MIAPIMSDLTADIVGMIGSALMVIAYAYSNMAERMSFLTFNLLNLVGSLMLGLSLVVHFNIASMALEIVWFFIALFGTVKALRARRA